VLSFLPFNYLRFAYHQHVRSVICAINFNNDMLHKLTLPLPAHLHFISMATPVARKPIPVPPPKAVGGAAPRPPPKPPGAQSPRPVSPEPTPVPHVAPQSPIPAAIQQITPRSPSPTLEASSAPTTLSENLAQAKQRPPVSGDYNEAVRLPFRLISIK